MERLIGLNLGGWFSQVDCIEEKDPEVFPGALIHMKNFIEPEDLDLIQEAGANHLRLPVDFFNITDEKTLEPNESVLELLEEAVQSIRSRKMEVILDLHKCPGHDFHSGTKQDQPFFTDPAFREGAKEVWRLLAERFKKDSGIVFEILNEPVAPNNDIWNEVQHEMHSFLRKVAPENPILLASNRWNHPSNFGDIEPVSDENVLYSFHMYEPLFFTHQNAPWSANPHLFQTTSYPGEYKLKEGVEYARMEPELGYWDQNRMREFLEPVLEFRDRTKLPVACNEFGVFLQAGRVGQLNWIQDLLEIFREYEIGYSYWNYKNLDFGVKSINESLHADLPQFQNANRLDVELLQILCEG